MQDISHGEPKIISFSASVIVLLMSVSKISIAVIILTYNQETLVSQAIESAIKQVADAEIRIYVIDDASTDQTRRVINSYENEYPGKVYSFFHKANQYQNGLPPEFPILRNIDATYFAFCDGDDYWISPLKLQKQLQVFSSHPNATIVHTGYFLGSGPSSQGKVQNLQSRTLKEVQKSKAMRSSFDFIQGNDVKKSTVLVKKSAIDFRLLERCHGIRAQDWLLCISASQRGEVKYIEEELAVYRINSSASFQGLSQSERTEIKNEIRWFCAIFLPEGQLKRAFRIFLLREFGRSIVATSTPYTLLRPYVNIARRIFSKIKPFMRIYR